MSGTGILPPPIGDRILAEGGSVPFARFMELALTDPDAGYYARSERFLGEEGDFSTAPRLAPAFNRAVAAFLADLIDVIPSGPVTIVEVGAGEGDLGAGVLGRWEGARPDLQARVTYFVDDVSVAQRRRQAGSLESAAALGWRVGVWGVGAQGGGGGDRAGSTGIVVSNELFDALPVHVVDARGGTPREAWVDAGDGPDGRDRVSESWRALSPAAARELELLAPGCALEEWRLHSADGFLELRPDAGALLGRWAGWYDDLAVLTIDYGDWLEGPAGRLPPAAPGDDEGDTRLPGALHRRSVRGYHRHRTVHDPYARIGRQDLTADVDFRALALHGEALGFEVVLYTTLAAFLVAAGAGTELRGAGLGGRDYALETDMADAPLASLLDPGGLGGRFKVMLQVKEGGGA